MSYFDKGIWTDPEYEREVEPTEKEV